jgi:hypothetical protein
MFQIAYKWIISLRERFCLNHDGYGDNLVLVHKITVFPVKTGTNAPRNRYFVLKLYYLNKYDNEDKILPAN